MLKIHYPDDIAKLKSDYLKLFDLSRMERSWKMLELSDTYDLKDILTGDFSFLVDVYYWYKSKFVTKRQKEIYEELFDYTAMQPKIAEFFMNKDNGFELSTCHYCNMAYINSYNQSLTYNDRMDFINHASKEELRDFFDKDMLPTEKLNSLIANRPYADETDFNSRGLLRSRIERYSRLKFTHSRNHFDIDHLLPKGICPIVGLSLFNFVPSCQVCNEKLKKHKELANCKADWLKISPTSSFCSFDDDVTIKMIPEKSCSTFFELQKNRGNYRLKFETNDDSAYNEFISMFHLTDRYNFHKELALHILSLKERYTPEKRKEISRILSAGDCDERSGHYTESQIEADIFNEDLIKHRCFAKLRQDMLHRN